jgi:hypothetical protein
MPIDKTPDLTRTGLVLTAISVVAGLVAAVPIVTSRAPNGELLPKKVAIVLTLLVAVAVFAIGSGILRIVGVKVLKDSDSDEPPKGP